MTDLSGANAIALSLGVVAAIILVIGGLRLMRAKSTRTKAYFMFIAAAVIIMNVMIWTV